MPAQQPILSLVNTPTACHADYDISFHAISANDGRHAKFLKMQVIFDVNSAQNARQPALAACEDTAIVAGFIYTAHDDTRKFMLNNESPRRHYATPRQIPTGEAGQDKYRVTFSFH